MKDEKKDEIRAEFDSIVDYIKFKLELIGKALPEIRGLLGVVGPERNYAIKLFLLAYWLVAKKMKKHNENQKEMNAHLKDISNSLRGK